MRTKILDSILAHWESKTMDVWNEYSNGRLTVNEAVRLSNQIQEETQAKYKAEVARILTIEEYYSN